MNYCPHCHCIVETTKHRHFEVNEVREEIVCNKCHLTIIVNHYPKKIEEGK